MDTIKYFGKEYPTRLVLYPILSGLAPVRVADIELWNAIEDAYYMGDKEAENIDDSIFFYFDDGFIASEPTDEEIIKKLEENNL